MIRSRILLIASLIVALTLPGKAVTIKALPPVPTPFAQLTAPTDASRFSFVVAGDNRSTGHGYPMPPVLDMICREVGIIRPNFVFWTGDVIEGYGDTPAEADREYDTLLGALADCGVPVFNAPGNHEIAMDPAMIPIYERRLGPLYGSFDWGNSHFIALDTSPLMPDGKIAIGALDEPQWAWLEADLKANAGARNIFVMMHHYVFGPPDPDTPDRDTGWRSTADRDRLHALMVKYGVRAVFSSHDHLYWHGVKDGIDYFITGGAGAPLDATPDKGGFLHYLLVTVDGSQITTQILQPGHIQIDYPDGDGKESMTERVWATNTNDFAVISRHIAFHMPPLPAGRVWSAKATVSYKGKAKPGDARVIAVTPTATGSEVDVEATLTPARTTEISVETAADGPTKTAASMLK